MGSTPRGVLTGRFSPRATVITGLRPRRAHAAMLAAPRNSHKKQ